MKSIFAAIKEFFLAIKHFLIPPRAFAWQTVLWLSVFSWAMAALSGGSFTQGLLANFSWIFLILGVAWWTDAFKKQLNILGLFIGPWITGALTCAYFSGLLDRRKVTLVLLVVWPLISAFFAALPTFLKPGPQLQMPTPADRQRLVILILSSAIVSCWIQFHLFTRFWFIQYPSLLADNFSDSAFVKRMEFRTEPKITIGDKVLNLTEPLLVQEIQDIPWPDVEQWLLFEANPFERETAQDTIEGMLRDMIASTLQGNRHLKEFNQKFWSFDFNVLPVDPDDPTLDEYRLELVALWEGPLSNELLEDAGIEDRVFDLNNGPEDTEHFGYKVTKTCLVKPQPVANAAVANNPAEWRGEISCDGANARTLAVLPETVNADTNTGQTNDDGSELVLPASQIQVSEEEEN